jgi:hypothetical protein
MCLLPLLPGSLPAIWRLRPRPRPRRAIGGGSPAPSNVGAVFCDVQAAGGSDGRMGGLAGQSARKLWGIENNLTYGLHSARRKATVMLRLHLKFEGVTIPPSTAHCL